MSNELHKRLISIAYDIIEEEKLPRPKSIKMRNSLNGTKRRKGVIHKLNDNYNIIIHTTEAKFYECETGKFRDKNGKRYRRGIGEKVPFVKIIETMSHEIAHLKFWRHDAQHKSYTTHISNKIKERLGLSH